MVITFLSHNSALYFDTFYRTYHIHLSKLIYLSSKNLFYKYRKMFNALKIN